MRDVVVGQRLIGSDGRPMTVTGVYPQGLRPVYEVHTSTGAKTRCDEEHLWTVKVYGEWKTLTLRELIQKGWCYGKAGLPRMRPAHFESASPLPIDPYILGVLLGDGSLTMSGVVVASSSVEIRDRVAHRLDEGRVSVRDDGASFSIVESPSLSKALLQLELRGCKAEDKFIPHNYLWASVEDRLDLLRGLIDTDGYVEKKKGLIEYYTTSARLAADVTHLARSLGALVRMRSKKDPKYLYKNEIRIGQPCYVLSINCWKDMVPATKTEKVERLKRRSKWTDRCETIVDVDYIGMRETQCISVSADDHLYVVDDFIVTHNTLFAASISEFFPEFEDTPVAAKEFTWLKDCLWLAFDKTPTDTLLQYRLGVPKVLDCRRILRRFGRDQFFSKFPTILRQVLTEEIRYVAADTVSEFDKILKQWWGLNVPVSDRGKPNTRAMWTNFGNDHSEFRYLLGDECERGGHTDRRILYICHSRAVVEQPDEATRTAEERKTEAMGRGEITFDITGQSGNGYGTEGSSILVTRKVPGPGNAKDRYEVLTNGDGTWEAGTRFSSLMPRVIQPNLRKYLRKVEACMPQDVPEQPQPEEKKES